MMRSTYVYHKCTRTQGNNFQKIIKASSSARNHFTRKFHKHFPVALQLTSSARTALSSRRQQPAQPCQPSEAPAPAPAPAPVTGHGHGHGRQTGRQIRRRAVAGPLRWLLETGILSSYMRGGDTRGERTVWDMDQSNERYGR